MGIVSELPKNRNALDIPNQHFHKILALLRARKTSVDAGMDVEGIKMELFKTLVISLKYSSPQLIEKLQNLVEQLVNTDLEPRTLDVKI